MGRKKAYLLGALIAIGLFIITGFIGGIINASVIVLLGFSSSMDAIMAGNYIPAIQQFLTGIPLHIIGAKYTAKVLNKITEKYRCNDEKYYKIISTVLFVFVFVVFPVLMKSRAGFVIYAVHILAFRSYWREQLSKMPIVNRIGTQVSSMSDSFANGENDIEADEDAEGYEVKSDEVIRAEDSEQVKENTGILPDDKGLIAEKTDIPKICYCRKCGAHLNEDAVFCHKCGTAVIVTDQELEG